MRKFGAILLWIFSVYAQPFSGADRLIALIHKAEEAAPKEVRAIAEEALPLARAACQEAPRDTLCQKYFPQVLDLYAYVLYFEQKLDSALVYSDSAFRLLEKNGYIREAAGVLGNLAYYYHQKGQITQAIDAHYKVWDRAAALQDTKLLFYTMNNIAAVFHEIGLQDSAIRFYLRALHYAEALKDPNLVGTVLNNLARIYYDQRLYREALRYGQMSLELRLRNRDTIGAATSLSNLGAYYEELGQTDSALALLHQALALARQSQSANVQALALSNLARIYMHRKEWDKAYPYLSDLLQLRAQAPEAERFRAYVSFMHFYEKQAEHTPNPILRKKLYLQVLQWNQKAAPLLPFIKEIDALRNYYLILYRVHSGLQDHAKALEAYKTYISYRDSLFNRKAQQKAIESRYLYEWQQREKALFQERLQEEERRKRLQIALLFAGLLALGAIIAAWFFQKLYRQTQIQRDIISQQKQKIEEAYHIIQEQHDELRRSLRYAQRIQKALLPSEEVLRALPYPSALWYQPQQEVGGDFYWVRFTKEPREYMLVLGDGTGHGVPGGFMTVLGISLLETIWEEGVTDLEGVAAALSHRLALYLHSEESSGVKDGIEALFMLIRPHQNRLKYVNAGGSVRGFFLSHHQIIELTKSGPGLGHDILGTAQAWEEREIELGKGGRLILFSDGLRDQLGENGRKWSLKQLRELVLETASLPADQALTHLKTEWSLHKGRMPQVDDVTVWIVDL
jgi:serine phosphatase RsbU (regulator of sigma subunit)